MEYENTKMAEQMLEFLLEMRRNGLRDNESDLIYQCEKLIRALKREMNNG
jgi:hypothetical protein